MERYLVQFQEPSFVFDCEQIYNRFLGKYDNVPESGDTTNDQHASKKQRVVSFLYDIKLPAVIEEKNMCLDSTSVKDKRTQSVETMTCSLDPTSVGEKHVQSVLHSSSVAAVNQITSTQIIQHVSSDPTPVEEEQNMIFHNTSTVDSAISSVPKKTTIYTNHPTC